jgi:formate hydrogenlyase subunit 4
LFYAFLIYMMLAVALRLAAPYFPDSSPGLMSREEEFQGGLLTLSVAAFALGLSGWFVGGAK